MDRAASRVHTRAMIAVALAALAVVIPGTGNPWDGGLSVTSPVEKQATAVASAIAGRPVLIRCPSPDEWAAMYGPRIAGATVGSAFADLSPDTCLTLERFGASATKPTKCVGSTVTRPARLVVVVTRHGRKVKTVLPVAITVTTWKPCFDGAHFPPQFPAAPTPGYAAYALALLTLTHESTHLTGVTDEAVTNCYGMQRVAAAARAFGDDAVDAQSIAEWLYWGYWSTVPGLNLAYYTSSCRPDTELNLTPNDGVWP
jgi:hypothetical protein